MFITFLLAAVKLFTDYMKQQNYINSYFAKKLWTATIPEFKLKSKLLVQLNWKIYFILEITRPV